MSENMEKKIKQHSICRRVSGLWPPVEAPGLYVVATVLRIQKVK